MADIKDFRNKNTKFTGVKGIEIPVGDTNDRDAGPATGTLRYNTDTGLAEFYTATGWAAVDAPPVVSNFTGTINSDTDSTITVNGSGFKPASIVAITGAAVSNTPRNLTTTYVSSGQLTANTNASSVNFIGGLGFNIAVINPSGLQGELTPAGTIDRDPSWSTGAGTIATWEDRGGSQSASVSATDPDGTSVTYSLATGALPGNSSLDTSTGAITSSDPTDVGGQTTYNFEIDATSNSFAARRSFNIIVNPTADGSSSARASTSASAIKALTGTTTNGYYWIQPSGAPSAQQMFCIMDSGVAGGGWTLALNIRADNITSMPNGYHAHYYSSFWTSQSSTFNAGNSLADNQKTYAYGYQQHSQVLFLMSNASNTNWRGWGHYTYDAGYNNSTLYGLCTGSTNTFVTSGGRTATASGSNSGTAWVTTTRSQTRGGDPFIDPNFTAGNGTSNNANDRLVFNASGTGTWWGNVTLANTRITTSAGYNNTSYGYTFAGLGGEHFNESGWGNDYAMSPIYPYCGGPYGYGDINDANGNYRWPGAGNGGVTPTSNPMSGCHDGHGGGAQTGIAMAVFVK